MSPTIKFRLSWSTEPAGPSVERPRPLMPRDNSIENNRISATSNTFSAHANERLKRGDSENNTDGGSLPGGGKLCQYFIFVLVSDKIFKIRYHISETAPISPGCSCTYRFGS